MLATRHLFRKHLLVAVVGLTGMTGMTRNVPAQCQLQKLLAADGPAGDEFGLSVALSGDTAIIGARARFDDDRGSDSGAVYVFEKVGGVWTQTAKLTAADGAMDDKFGGSVALSGDTAVIGATGDDDLGSRSGSAYVFEKIDGIWTPVAKLTAVDGAAHDFFGKSVAVSGNTAMIGVTGDDDRGDRSGSAYVFERVGGVWTQTAKLTAADGAADDFFGFSVALSGNTGVIGAPGDNDLGSDFGSAYVFEKIAGVWTDTAKLTASDGRANDVFGSSVALSGNTAVIGATGDDDLGSSSGSAYVFEKVAGVWTQTGKLNASDGATQDEFGRSVAVSGDTAVIGANLDDALGISSGSGYVFEKFAVVWTQTAKLTAADGAVGHGFGFSVALSGDTAVIGAPGDNDLGTNSGSAYIFVLSGDDCNSNSVPDLCDIASGSSTDCNGNSIPDDCETDGDGDEVIDDCDPCPLDNPDDNDADGVCDSNDACADTPSGFPVNECGCLEAGACCTSTGKCGEFTRDACAGFAGVYQGDGSVCAEGCAFGDLDGDGDVDLVDFGMFERCFTGAGGEAAPGCSEADVDGCGPIDLEDFAAFRAALTGP